MNVDWNKIDKKGSKKVQIKTQKDLIEVERIFYC